MFTDIAELVRAVVPLTHSLTIIVDHHRREYGMDYYQLQDHWQGIVDEMFASDSFSAILFMEWTNFVIEVKK